MCRFELTQKEKEPIRPIRRMLAANLSLLILVLIYQENILPFRSIIQTRTTGNFQNKNKTGYKLGDKQQH